MGAVEVRTATQRSGVAFPYAVTGRQGRSFPVVLVHAYVESWRYFEHVLHLLPESIYALAPTQRGHRSVTGDVAGYRISDFATDIVLFCSQARWSRATAPGPGPVEEVRPSRPKTGTPAPVRKLLL